MVGEHGMADVNGRALGHVAGDAVVGRLCSGFGLALAAGVFMAGQALLAIMLGTLRNRDYRVRGMTTPAPQSGAAGLLASALGELFHMTGHSKVVRLPVCPHERKNVIRQEISRFESRMCTPGSANTGFAAQVAVGTDAVATGWVELGRVDNVRQAHRVPVLLTENMARPLTVTAFATDTSLKKRCFCKAVLCSLDWLELARVAFQAADFDGTGKVSVVVLLKTWRDIPFACLRVVGDRRLEQVACQH